MSYYETNCFSSRGEKRALISPRVDKKILVDSCRSFHVYRVTLAVSIECNTPAGRVRCNHRVWILTVVFEPFMFFSKISNVTPNCNMYAKYTLWVDGWIHSLWTKVQIHSSIRGIISWIKCSVHKIEVLKVSFIRHFLFSHLVNTGISQQTLASLRGQGISGASFVPEQILSNTRMLTGTNLP